jgi:hypothetical protein
MHTHQICLANAYSKIIFMKKRTSRKSLFGQNFDFFQIFAEIVTFEQISGRFMEEKERF